MHLKDLVRDPGPIIAYYPMLKPICGSTNAALVASQLLYWTGKQRDRSGWIQKRVTVSPDGSHGPERAWEQSLASETGSSYKEIQGAVRKLLQRGLIGKRHDRLTHKTYLRLNQEALVRAWRAYYGDDQTDMPDVLQVPPPESQGDRTDVPSGPPLKGTSRDYPEITSGDPAQDSKPPNDPKPSRQGATADGLPIPDELVAHERRRDEATAAFESALGVSKWPWCTNDVWTAMADLVCSAWEQQPDVFTEFVEWIRGQTRATAAFIKNIRSYPQEFIDTSWPLFLSSRTEAQPAPEECESDLERRIREGIGMKGSG